MALLDEEGEIEDFLDAPSVLAVITRLQQIADSSGILDENQPHSAKVEWLTEFLDDHPDEKFVVFTKYKRFARIVNQMLVAKKIGVATYWGGMSKEDRAASVNKFHKDPDCRMFLATTTTASLGLSITATDNVIFLDQLWSPAQQLQAESRVQGIGRGAGGSRVNVWILVCMGTIDERIAKVLKAKEEMAQAVLAGRVLRSYVAIGLEVTDETSRGNYQDGDDFDS